jgi:hypothetical protein
MKKIILLFAVTFFFVHTKAQIISDFENWHNFIAGGVTLSIPNGWNSTDSTICFYGNFTNPGGAFVPQVSKELPGNGGGTAIKAETKMQDDIIGYIGAGPMPCVASNSTIMVDASLTFLFEGGTPFTYNPYSAGLWVKNNPVGGDTTQITLLALDDSDGGDSVVSVADTLLGSAISAYTHIILPFKMMNASFSTTKIRVIISSSANFGIDTVFTNLHDGTWVVADDIMISAPDGTSQYLLSEKVAAVYPTCIESSMHVNLQNEDRNHYQLRLLDMNGRLVSAFEIYQTFNTFDLSAISKGSYVFNIVKDNRLIQSGKISKE